MVIKASPIPEARFRPIVKKCFLIKDKTSFASHRLRGELPTKLVGVHSRDPASEKVGLSEIFYSS
jgi:hypothetical protein